MLVGVAIRKLLKGCLENAFLGCKKRGSCGHHHFSPEDPLLVLNQDPVLGEMMQKLRQNNYESQEAAANTPALEMSQEVPKTLWNPVEWPFYQRHHIKFLYRLLYGLRILSEPRLSSLFSFQIICALGQLCFYLDKSKTTDILLDAIMSYAYMVMHGTMGMDSYDKMILVSLLGCSSRCLQSIPASSFGVV